MNTAGLKLGPGSASVLDRQLSRLSRVVDRTVIIANDAGRFAAAVVPVIADLLPDAGARGALYTAVHAAATDRTLVIACDMPFASEPLLAHLVDAGRWSTLRFPEPREDMNRCAPRIPAAAGELRRLIDEKRSRLGDVARIPGLVVREIAGDELNVFGPEEVLFFNLNTPDDYARAIDLDGEYHYPS